MLPDLSPAESIIHEALGRVFPAAQLEVRLRGQVVLSRAYGWLDPETQQHPTQPDTLFDLASVTKLFVATAFMTLVEEGRVALDQPVCMVLPAFAGPRPIRPYEDPLHPGALVQVVPPTDEKADAGRVTFRHLLVHNSGLPAWRPLYREGSPAAALQTALDTCFSYPTGARVVYSDIGLILLGRAMEQLTGQPLDAIVRERVTGPLGLSHTDYIGKAPSPSPQPQSAICNPQSAIRNPHSTFRNPHSTFRIPKSEIAPTEFCAWRNRRIIGEVHDENAAGLGGVAGHAGLFSVASDVAALGQMYLDGGWPLLRPDTVAEMTRLHAEDGAVRRGLGFALWSPDPEASGNPFSQRAFGHAGFTGTSLWIDPDRALVIACLTNRVYYGRDAAGILAFRVALHKAIVEAVKRET